MKSILSTMWRWSNFKQLEDLATGGLQGLLTEAKSDMPQEMKSESQSFSEISCEHSFLKRSKHTQIPKCCFGSNMTCGPFLRISLEPEIPVSERIIILLSANEIISLANAFGLTEVLDGR